VILVVATLVQNFVHLLHPPPMDVSAAYFFLECFAILCLRFALSPSGYPSRASGKAEGSLDVGFFLSGGFFFFEGGFSGPDPLIL